MSDDHDRYVRILIGRLLAELVRKKVFDRDDLANIEGGTSDRLGDPDSAARWQHEVFTIAMRFVPPDEGDEPIEEL